MSTEIGMIQDNRPTWYLPDGYSRLRVKPRIAVMTMALGEAKALAYGEHIWFHSVTGELRACKVNGQPRTWKTRPGDVDIPVKYGMYEYAVFRMRNGSWVTEAWPVVKVQ